jgi:hypothetical protein
MNSVIAETLKITPERARLVEAFLRLQYSTLDALSRADIRREYRSGGICGAIDADIHQALRLADSYGLPPMTRTPTTPSANRGEPHE